MKMTEMERRYSNGFLSLIFLFLFLDLMAFAEIPGHPDPFGYQEVQKDVGRTSGDEIDNDNVSPGIAEIRLNEIDPLKDVRLNQYFYFNKNLNVSGRSDHDQTAIYTPSTHQYSMADANLLGRSQTDGHSWKLNGNRRTTPGKNFLGTTDNQAFELKVNDTRALRIEPHSISPNVISGYKENSVTRGVYGATVGGGGGQGGVNLVTDHYGTVGGGYHNRAGDHAGTADSAEYATVAGGLNNTSSKFTATVSGGWNNTASGDSATVAGGWNNVANNLFATVSGGLNNSASDYATTISGGEDNIANGLFATVGGGLKNIVPGVSATVAGGEANTASGFYATVSGGFRNEASGKFSFASGRRAKAYHQGSFVWGDSIDADIRSSDENQFIARASGGFYFNTSSDLSIGAWLSKGGNSWSSLSDRNLKENFAPVNGQEIMDRLAQIPITTWNLKSQGPSIRHIGPMAQDFYAAFGLGEDDRYVNTVDTNGVALVTIQWLYHIAQEKEVRIQQLEKELFSLEERLSLLEAKIHGTER